MSNIYPISPEQISPYIRYVNNYAPRWSYTEPMRILFDYEFMYVIAGRSHIIYNGEEYNLEKGDFFYFKPGIPNRMRVNSSDGFHTHCIHFDWTPPLPEADFSVEDMYLHPTSDNAYYKRAQLLSDRPLAQPETLSLPTYIKNTPGSTYELFNRCYYTYLKGDMLSKMQLKADFISILTLLCTYAESGTTRENTILHPSISHAVEYIQLNYQTSLSVSELAKKCHLSEKYFGTLFKDNLGKSMNQFLLEVRIDAAKRLLVNTSFSLEEISIKVGFDTVYYFSNCFKKNTGLSPSIYRKTYTRE